MRYRIKIWLLNRRLLRTRGIKITYWCVPCSDEGTRTQVGTLRFLFIGCECGMHSWYRRRGF